MTGYAMVFPGQGSQALGMLHRVADDHREIVDTFAEASQLVGYDLWQLAQDGPLERLNSTEFTQPLLLTAGVALWRVWQSNVESGPRFMAGHSLGEFTALVCAAALSFSDAISLVAARGRFMQRSTSKNGTMAAIAGLAENKLLELQVQLRQQNIFVEVANYNSPGQLVFAGETTPITQLVKLAKEAGARVAKILPVSVPSHCSLMNSAAQEFAQLLETTALAVPRIPVIQNVDATASDELTAIRAKLVTQLVSPVQWINTIRYIVESGIDTILECGPGKVLTGLNKRIAEDITVDYLDDPDRLTRYINNNWN